MNGDSRTPNEALTIVRLKRDLAALERELAEARGDYTAAFNRLEQVEKERDAARAEVEAAARWCWDIGYASGLDPNRRNVTFDAAWSRYQQERGKG